MNDGSFNKAAPGEPSARGASEESKEGRARREELALRRLQTETFLEFARLVAIKHQRLRVLFEAEGLEGVTPGQSRVLMILFQAREPLTASCQ